MNLYLGKKYKHIQLEDGYILSAKLTKAINEPLKLELVIDINHLYKLDMLSVVDYLVDINTELILDISTNLKYLFTKKHNQNKNLIFIQQSDSNYLTLSGNENLDTNYAFSNQTFQTINNSNSKIVSNLLVNNNRFELIIATDKKSSQNLADLIKNEEISITSQTLSEGILNLTFYSEIANLNYQKNQLIYGQIYNTNLSSFLGLLLPNFDIILDFDRPINYTVEPKQNLEILNDVLTNSIMRDGGFDLLTGKNKLEIFNPKTTKSKFRCLTSQTTDVQNPIIISIKENYPTLSAQIITNQTYIQEGDKLIIDFATRYTRYKGNFIFDGQSIDILTQYQSESESVSLSKTSRDVRPNYLKTNLKTLSNRLIS